MANLFEVRRASNSATGVNSIGGEMASEHVIATKGPDRYATARPWVLLNVVAMVMVALMRMRMLPVVLVVALAMVMPMLRTLRVPSMLFLIPMMPWVLCMVTMAMTMIMIARMLPERY